MDNVGDKLADDLLLPEKRVKKLAQDLVENIYKEKIYSPFLQLSKLEDALKKDETITYRQLAYHIQELSQEMTTCISCGEETAYPCHTINTKNLSTFRKRNWKDISGTSRGDGHNPDKKSDKEILVDGLINSMDKFNLSDIQKDNLRDNLERVRPELLVGITGSMIINQERQRPMDEGVYENDIEQNWYKHQALKEITNEYADWDKPNTAERLGLDKKDLMIERGLDELLPLRDRNYIKYGTIPKYKEKIDLEDYLAWWKVVNWVVNYLPEAFKGIRKILEDRFPTDSKNELLHYLLQGQLPIPCEKNKKWHEKMNSNRRLAFGVEDEKVIDDYYDDKIKAGKEYWKELFFPTTKTPLIEWGITFAIYTTIAMTIIMLGLAIYAGYYWVFGLMLGVPLAIWILTNPTILDFLNRHNHFYIEIDFKTGKKKLCWGKNDI